MPIRKFDFDSRHSILYKTQFTSQISKTFIKKFHYAFEGFLKKIGLSFLSTKQAFILVLCFLIMNFSYAFNIGAIDSSLAFEAIDSSEIEILDGTTISYGLYVPSIPTEEKIKFQNYVVKEGDSPTIIAHQFKISPDTLVSANNIVDGFITPGQELVIPPTTGTVHEVKKGETFSTIVKKYEDYGANKKIISRWNSLDDSENIQIGQKLIIPGVEAYMMQKSTRAVVYNDSRTPSYRSADKNAIISGGGTLLKPTNGLITQGFTSYHYAIDIANKVGTPVYASDDGVVIRADMSGWNGGYGKVVVIQHSNGLKTLYAHLNVLNIKQGETVKRGQQIAEMGNTGRSTGPHLHCEVIDGTYKKNPLKYW